MKTRKELAEVLRRRQLKLLPMTSPKFGVTKKAIKALSEDQIIECYLKNECGEMIATLDDVDAVLEENPRTFDEFWDMLQSLIRARDISLRAMEEGKE